jgi:hypothetical protein
MSENGEVAGVDRRTVLRRTAAVGALVWTAPVVDSLTAAAHADGRAGTWTPPGSPEPCVITFAVHFCRTYVYKKSGGYTTIKKWFRVTLPVPVTRECCTLFNEAIAAYQSSARREWDCLAFIWKLIKSGCFSWGDWSCEEDRDYDGDDD